MSSQEPYSQQKRPETSQPTEVDPLAPPPMLARTLTGSCHCGHVTYTVDAELPFRPSLPRASRCNCRSCLKTGWTNFQLPHGRDSFHLLTPNSLEDEGIVDYINVSKVDGREIHRYFCKGCGVTICAGGHYTIKPPVSATATEAERGKEDAGASKPEANGTSQQRQDSHADGAMARPNSIDPSSTSASATGALPLTEGAAPSAQPPADTSSHSPSSPSYVYQPPHDDPSIPRHPLDPNYDIANSFDPSAPEADAPETDTTQGDVVHFFAVNLVSLDQPQEGLDLSIFQIEYFDGRNDNWLAGAKEGPWGGGTV